ncbi:hypothetical protein ACGF7W_19605 [Streptomyces sp. NPDC048219]|uniref:hypothetical protein n=1 Tax=Streptomyces sp. NPDC048219 TaxID=3365517 RepID=UPI00371533D6
MTQPVLVDAYAAQAATGIPAGTIRVWLHRGRITRHGHDARGRALVDLREVRARARRAPAESA